MEYVYAALMLHKAGKKVDGEGIKKVVEAAGIQPDEAKIKALVASLDGVDIGKTLDEAKAMRTQAPPAPAEVGKKEAKKESKEEKEEHKEEAAEGLSALFS